MNTDDYMRGYMDAVCGRGNKVMAYVRMGRRDGLACRPYPDLDEDWQIHAYLQGRIDIEPEKSSYEEQIAQQVYMEDMERCHTS